MLVTSATGALYDATHKDKIFAGLVFPGLWQYEYILIPTCKGSHWYLIVVKNPGALLESRVCTPGSMDGCWIWALDSLNQSRKEVMGKVRVWLECVAKQEEVLLESEPRELDLMVCSPAHIEHTDHGYRTRSHSSPTATTAASM